MLYFSRNTHIFLSEIKVTVICSMCPLSPSKLEENCNISGLSHPNCKQAIWHRSAVNRRYVLSFQQNISKNCPSQQGHLSLCQGDAQVPQLPFFICRFVPWLTQLTEDDDVNCQWDASQENLINKSYWACTIVETFSFWCFRMFLAELPCPALCAGDNIYSIPSNTLSSLPLPLFWDVLYLTRSFQ